MRRSRAFLILITTSGLLLFFQNCAKAPTLAEDPTAASAATATGGSLKVTSNVHLLSSGSSSQALKARYVNPIALHFGTIAHDFSYQFPYSLDLASGQITVLATSVPVGQLSSAEADDLDQILGDAVVASRRDFMASGTLCASVLVEGYAGLVTDQGNVVLGHGTSACDVSDLYRDDGGGNDSGLKVFLATLAARL